MALKPSQFRDSPDLRLRRLCKEALIEIQDHAQRLLDQGFVQGQIAIKLDRIFSRPVAIWISYSSDIEDLAY